MRSSHLGLYSSPWSEFLDIQISECLVQDHLFYDSTSILEWLCRIHIHVLRPQPDWICGRPLEGHD